MTRRRASIRVTPTIPGVEMRAVAAHCQNGVMVLPAIL